MLKWCEGCVWATDCGGVTYCPWGAGSCVRMKHSFSEPDELKLWKRIHIAEYGGLPLEKKEDEKK